MSTAEQRSAAYADGRAAYLSGKYLADNPHRPIPPGDLLLARLWRAGWWQAQREKEKHNG
jgi:hypothetical protein